LFEPKISVFEMNFLLKDPTLSASSLKAAYMSIGQLH